MEQHNQLEDKKYKCETVAADEMLQKAEDVNDPMFLARLMLSLRDERERSNSMMATVIRKLEGLEMKVEALEGELKKAKRKVDKKNVMLGEVDSQLLEYVKREKKVIAQEVQKKFNYKGRNGASSRLHKLYSLGCLEKRQAGRVVYYLPK